MGQPSRVSQPVPHEAQGQDETLSLPALPPSVSVLLHPTVLK